MNRALLLLASTFTIAGAAFTLQSCGTESVEAAAPVGPLNSLMTLPDGSTMVAAKGSVIREIGAWLAGREGESATFQFGGFRETRPALTSAGLGQGAELATILRAAPAATIEIAGDAAQAEELAQLLADRGIGKERMTVVEAAGLGSVALTVHRGSTDRLLTANR